MPSHSTESLRDGVDLRRLPWIRSLAADYRAYCWSRPYRVLMADPVAKPICEKLRPVVRAIQRAAVKAGSAIRSADNFVRNNPTVNAAAAISAAWAAVRRFQNAVPRVR